MKGKTSDSNKNCFSFPSGYSLSLSNTCTVSFLSVVFSSNTGNGILLTKANLPPLATVNSYSVISACLFNYMPKNDKPSPPNIIVGYPSLTNKKTSVVIDWSKYFS